jgi:uroporphyrinogen-III synthase
METFDGIFITSAKAAEIFAAKFREAQRNFQGIFYVLGKRSSELLKNLGQGVSFGFNANTAEELLEIILQKEIKNKRFLFPRGNRSLRIIPETLKGIAEVAETIVYQTIDLEPDEKELFEIKEKLESGKISAICFFSPSGVEGFLGNFEEFSQGEIKIAAIGKTTARFIEEKKLRVDFVSKKATAEDFAAELVSYLRN